ncbi:Uncharacterized protein Fot_21829 [Forsythia ovata]|uniref:Uncharacterized protein n=1 Tax=Forsythia ovata TaxID=205694 RepID=A0ABD1UVZ2_9LAMI
MDTPTRIMTRSAAKKDSPDSGKKPPFHSKQKNPHDEAGHRRLGACSSKGKHKIEKSDKPIVDKVAQSVSSSKIKNPQVYEAQISSFLEELKAKFDGEMRSEVNPGQMVIYKSLKTGASSGLGDQQNFSDLLDDKFYTEDVMEQVEEIIKSAEKSKNSDTIEA